MSSSSFRVSFEGAALADGEIDVRDLAPALLALGDVVQSANRALNGDKTQVSLKMRATAKGSFVALLSVDMTFLAALGDLLDVMTENPDRVVAADKLMDLLLKGGQIVAGSAAAAGGLFWALKKLRGQRPDRVETRPDGTNVIVHNDIHIALEPGTLKLLQDVATREAVEKFADKALGIPDVTSVTLGDDEADEEVVLEKSDRQAMAVPEPVQEDLRTESTQREVLLKIITSAFRDGYKWRLSDGGEKPFTASIEDAEFVNGIMDGKIAISANDTLKCLVREDQKLGPSGLSKEVTILRVIEHIPGAKQLKLL